jgi:hypothetical protein
MSVGPVGPPEGRSRSASRSLIWIATQRLPGVTLARPNKGLYEFAVGTTAELLIGWLRSSLAWVARGTASEFRADVIRYGTTCRFVGGSGGLDTPSVAT